MSIPSSAIANRVRSSRSAEGWVEPGLERRQLVEDRLVEVVQPDTGRVGHAAVHAGSPSSISRNLARHRPRVGPMLPCGIPSASDTAA